MEYILRTHHLTKVYNKVPAVEDLGLSVRKGEIYGFLGQNGAGKTTTIRMIMGLVYPTSGEIELFGEKIRRGSYKHFERIGAMLENPGFYGNLTTAENLEVHRILMGVPDRECVENALNQVGMLGERNKKVKDFSLGMKQRLGLARALLHHPELLVLDEPTNGLDPVGIKEVRLLLTELSQNKKISVFISSHILSEVQQLATRIGIIHRGRLLEEIDIETLQMKNRHYIKIKVNDDQKAAMHLEQSLNITDYRITESGVIRTYEKLNRAAEINRVLIEKGVEVRDITTMNDTLEDYFISLTGGSLDV